MKRKSFKALAAIIVGVLMSMIFTSLIYNLDVLFQLFQKLATNILFIYTCITIFYFFLYIFLVRRINIRAGYLIVLTIVVPIVIDALTLISDNNLIPLRFPFASIFPILGAVLGYFYSRKKWLYFYFFLSFCITFFIASQFLFIPKIVAYMGERNDAEIINKIPSSFLNSSLFASTFYTIDNKPVLLKDTAAKQCSLVECFFTFCPPCKVKEVVLKKVQSKFAGDKNFKLIFICDGSISSFDDFIKNADQNKTEGITFLYDKDSVLNKASIQSFPFEMLTSNYKTLATQVGFTNDSTDAECINYYEAEVKKINAVLNEK